MSSASNPDRLERLRDRLESVIGREHPGRAVEAGASLQDELDTLVDALLRRHAELAARVDELAADRDRYRELFDAVPDGYVVSDVAGTVREVNAAGARLLGVAPSELVGGSIDRLVDPSDRRAFSTQLGRLRAGGPGAHLDIDLVVRDHRGLPVNLRAVLTGDGVDDDTEVHWIVHDRRGDPATEELRANEARLRALFDSAPVGIVLTDAGGDIVFANQRADELLGRPGSAIRLDEWIDGVAATDRATVRAALDGARRTGAPATLGHWIGSDDRLRWVTHTIDPFTGTDGEPDGAVSTLVDVTDELRAIAELEAARDFTDAIVDTAGALVTVLRPDGSIERFNRACEVATGRDAGDVIGRNFLDELVPDDEREEAGRAFADVVAGGPASRHVNDWVTTSGERRTISWTDTTVHDHDGHVRAVVATGIDITENRLLQQRVAQSDRLESVGRLAAGVAHDFNNTLATLSLRLDRIERRHAGDEDTRRDIVAARTTFERSQRLIADLLSFSRQHPVALEVTDVGIETTRVVAMLDSLFGSSISTRVELTDEDAHVVVDPGRFEQVMTNLLLNARDAMPDGGTIDVTVSIDRITAATMPPGTDLVPGRYVRITVSDTGSGIAPADLPRVFDPYFTTKPAARGTGLGLATTHGTIAQAGGAIIADSVPGTGSTFTIWLPRAAPSDVPR